ncbi:Concanavalin A-like lectin/glucanases superfamily protein [Cyclobacterium lianum]|uniref:Concanavalin A-like lectin/glucanases superfamily protein n=1 Tax=Cyclobacterium lianum TaxID=388280 RepID=A0A1M7PCM1_9BACT|nr:LamG domain-containing protein [Cyclobacterium lianum]SHN14629.1 Concanavalin A-like lectin/glucanases superfamily protein [Cyclobacterium lianum]
MIRKYLPLLPLLILYLMSCACKERGSTRLNEGLLGHWKLAGDVRDHSGANRHATIHGEINFDASGPTGRESTAVDFSSVNTWLEIPLDQSPRLGKKDFTIAGWIDLSDTDRESPADIMSQYDSLSKTGFHLSTKTQAVTTSLANYCQLHFGINADISSDWIDLGSPDSTVGAFSLASFEGSLYAGLSHQEKEKSGNVYRLDSLDRWIDCGSPDASNSVMALAVHNGELYAGTGKYRFAGSALPESENLTAGGRVMRYGADGQWVSTGKLPDTEAIGGLISFNGSLYASSLYHPAGFFRLDNDKWVACPTPEGKRVVALAVYDGYLYASSYDSGNVYRYDGHSWTDCGLLGDNTQTYSFAIYYGNLYVGTWPSGRVYRFDGIDNWKDAGRLGNELEVMGMLVHNGTLVAGTLPLAEVYAYRGDTTWKKLVRLDHTPDVKYRRAWTMAENNGILYCSTLPSGKIFGFELGRNVLSPGALKSGWQHVAAVKSKGELALYINGEKVARKTIDNPGQYDLNSAVPLKIGFGANHHFKGKMADFRLYHRALHTGEIIFLSDPNNL